MEHPKVIEYSMNNSKTELNGTIDALNSRKARINCKMRLLARKLRQDENMDVRDLDEYQRLNDELKGVKLWEAELAYTRNML